MKGLFKKIAAAVLTVAMIASVGVVGFATASNEPVDGGTPDTPVTGRVYATGITVTPKTNSFGFEVTYNTDVESNSIGYTMLAYKANVVAGYEGTGANVVGIAQNTTNDGKTFTFDVAKDDGIENAETDSREVGYGDSVVILLSSDAAAGAVGYLYTLKGVADSASIEDVAVSVPYYQANDENKVKDAITAQITEGVSVTIAKDSTEETKVVEGVTVKFVDLETKEVTFTVPAFEQGSLSYAGGDVVAGLTVYEEAVGVTALSTIADVAITKAEVDGATGDDETAKIKAAIAKRLAERGLTFTDGASFSQLVASVEKENAEVNAELASLLAVEVESASSNDYSATYDATVTVAEEATIVEGKVVAATEISSNEFTVVQYILGAEEEIVELALTQSNEPATVDSEDAENADIIAAAKAAIIVGGVKATVTDSEGNSEEDTDEAALWKDVVDTLVANSENWTVTGDATDGWEATFTATIAKADKPADSKAVNDVTITATVNVTVQTSWNVVDVDFGKLFDKGLVISAPDKRDTVDKDNRTQEEKMIDVVIDTLKGQTLDVSGESDQKGTITLKADLKAETDVEVVITDVPDDKVTDVTDKLVDIKINATAVEGYGTENAYTLTTVTIEDVKIIIDTAGDVSRDGKVQLTDALDIYKYAGTSGTEKAYVGDRINAADVCGNDGKVQLVDALDAYKYAGGTNKVLPK